MDHTHLLNQIRDINNLKRSFDYAVKDRLIYDAYFDYFELDYVLKNKEAILNEIFLELKDIDKYYHRPAYAYFPPKTYLCYRRMIYISFKDLVIRYAFTTIIAEYLNDDLSINCFANRRATGERSKNYLLENFATKSWPNFCDWQRECADKYSVLLKTDISAFYDSISHEYLIELIANQLAVQNNTDLIKLFKKILSIPVISYTPINVLTANLNNTKQGLAIGNNTDGFLANLYLKDVDEIMSKVEGIEFGRYNDDIRIFGNERKTVLGAVLSLQQALLSKGLNLNAGKTKIAENKKDVEELRSKDHEVYFYYIDDDAQELNNSIVKSEIDRPFDEFDREFKITDEIENDQDAKDFCKFMSNIKKLPYEKRNTEYIDKIGEILKYWQGSGRHASWLIVETSFRQGIPPNSKKYAQKLLLESLKDEQVDSYSKYRLLHHLIKQRTKDKRIRFWDDLSEKQKKVVIESVPDFLLRRSFELNIIALYLLKIIGKSDLEIKEYINNYIPKPVLEPIKKIHTYISSQGMIEKTEIIESYKEPDEIQQPY